MQMQFELVMLTLAAALGIVQLVLTSVVAQPQRGLKWNVGPRDTPIALTGAAGRLERAFANYRETFAIFAALVVAAYLGGKLDSMTQLGSALYVGARALYVPLYALGVTYVRSLVWVASLAGILMILLSILL